MYSKYTEKEFAQRAQATTWAKEEKKRLQQADFSVKYNILFNKGNEQWKATLFIDDKRK